MCCLKKRSRARSGPPFAKIRRSQPLEADEVFYAASRNRSGPAHSEEGNGQDEPEAREEEAHGRALLGADVRWVAPRMEVTAEASWLPAGENALAEGGAFVQGAVRLIGPLWAVGRAESYTSLDGVAAHLGYAGVTVRGDSRFVVKAGRQFSQRPSIRIPDGWFLSFSSLF